MKYAFWAFYVIGRGLHLDAPAVAVIGNLGVSNSIAWLLYIVLLIVLAAVAGGVINLGKRIFNNH